MRYDHSRATGAVVGFALVAGVVWLVHYALGLDGYYAPSAVSRWEHAWSWPGMSWAVVAGFVLTFGAAAACALRATAPTRGRLALPLPPLLAVYGLGFVMAWYPMTGGH